MFEETLAEYRHDGPGTNPKGGAGDVALQLLVGPLETVTVVGSPPRPLVSMLERTGAVLRTSFPGPGERRGDLTVLDTTCTLRFGTDATFRAQVTRSTDPRGAMLLLEPSGAVGHGGIALRLRDGRVVAAAPHDGTEFLPDQTRPWRQRLRGALKGQGLELMRDAVLVPRRRATHLVDLLAEQAGPGADVREHAWRLRDPGRYRTNKAILELRPPGATDPSMVVKLLRDPGDADRLEREWRALRLLQALDVPDVPRPLSRGLVRGRPYLLQTAVRGRPLSDLAAEGAGGPALRSTLGWFRHLATTTAFPCQPGELASAVAELVDRFDTLYTPGAVLARALDRRLARLRRRADEVPTVVMHGDAGTWNVLVDGPDRPQVLDWEAAEPRGAPLFDILYLMRSYAVRVGRAHGQADALRAYERALLRPSPLAELQQDAVIRTAEAVRMPPELADPLLVLCWLHRAVKEAARRTAGSLSDGHYVQLLERCLAPSVRAHAPVVAVGGRR